MKKALKGTALALSLLALAGCGQEYNPGPDAHDAKPVDAGDVFSSDPDSTVYRTASYESLRAMLVDILGVNANTTTCTVSGVVVNPCPQTNPVGYLDANRNALGTAIFAEDPLATQAPSLMTSGGFKVWILASSSACGLMMQADPTRLFPNGVSDYTFMYNALLGRNPTSDEAMELDALQASFADDEHKGAAACSVVLGTLENLSAN